MLPRADVVVTWEVDADSLLVPSVDDLEHGGFGTRQYSVAFVLEASWEEAQRWLQAERLSVARLAASATDEAEFDELALMEETDTLLDPLEGFVQAPDVGMRAPSLALCAAGCLTGASCRGHAGRQAWASWPTILFSADRVRASLLEGLARQAGCGLASRDGRLELWAPSLDEMLQFGELLIEARPQFDAIPLPPAFHDMSAE